MSESGCLVSSCFSTVTVHNEVFTPKVSIETNHQITDTIVVNESGHQSTVEKDQLDVGSSSSSFDNIDLSSSASIKANSVTIAQPPSSIVKNMYLVVTGNNFLVSAAAGTTDFRIDIGTDVGDDAVKTSVFDDGGGAEIHLIQGSSSDADNGSILAMNTVIPLLINYSYTRDKDIIDAINKQGYFRTGTAETLHVAIDGGIPAAGKGSLYNKGTSPRNLYINLSSSSASDPLLGAYAGVGTTMSLITAAINNGASVNSQSQGHGGTVTFKIVCDFQLI
jgi:hypothetical protein